MPRSIFRRHKVAVAALAVVAVCTAGPGWASGAILIVSGQDAPVPHVNVPMQQSKAAPKLLGDTLHRIRAYGPQSQNALSGPGKSHASGGVEHTDSWRERY